MFLGLTFILSLLASCLMPVKEDPFLALLVHGFVQLHFDLLEGRFFLADLQLGRHSERVHSALGVEAGVEGEALVLIVSLNDHQVELGERALEVFVREFNPDFLALDVSKVGSELCLERKLEDFAVGIELIILFLKQVVINIFPV